MLIKVLLTSRSAAALQALQTALTGCADFQFRTHLLTNGHTDPLHGINWNPDLVVLRFDAEHMAEIAAWSEEAQTRPPLVVVGPAANVEAVRLAIRSGAKDFLAEPVRPSELVATLKRVAEEAESRRHARSTGALTAFVGAAGGVGTSLIATNVAQMLASGQHQTAMIDLDLTFAPLSHLLDLHPQQGLLEALEAVDSLDSLALAGFGAVHASGLKLIGSTLKRAVLSRDISVERFNALLNLLKNHHSHVIVDTPHVLDALNAVVFGAADFVHVILQQSVLHVRNAARLARVLREELGVRKDHVKFVLNRYSKDATVSLDDVRRALDVEQVYVVANHYKSALQSIDAGVPLYDSSRTAPVARGLAHIYAELSGQKSPERGGFLKRALPSFLRD